jgi:gamma-glutamyltranspeptidase
VNEPAGCSCSATAPCRRLIGALLDDSLDLREALERPRWRSIEGRFALEDGTDARLERALGTLGHEIEKLLFGDALFGAAAAGLDLETGSLLAATDPRREVWAAGW